MNRLFLSCIILLLFVVSLTAQGINSVDAGSNSHLLAKNDIDKTPAINIYESQDKSKTGSPGSRPKVGLVLSGGGAKGFAHIGVLKVLEEAGIQVDIITGTSFGAVIGGLYAIGFSVAEIESLAVNIDWVEIFDDHPDRRHLVVEEKLYDEIFSVSLPLRGIKPQLPSGLTAGQKISNMLTGMTWPVHHIHDFEEFPRPFACVATNIETGQPVVLKKGVLAEAIRASVAIPSLFTPVYLDGKMLVDGFVVRNLPVSDAIDLGADILIGVDVGRPIKQAENIESFIEVINQTMSFQSAESDREQSALLDYIIKPEIDYFTIADFNKVKQIIRTGEVAARNDFSKFKALADSLNSLGEPSFIYKPISSDSLYLIDIEVSGLKKTKESMVMDLVDLKVPGWCSRRDIERNVNRLHSTQYYERVTYTLSPGSEGTALELSFLEKPSSQLRAGFNYNNDTKAAVRFNLTARNQILEGSLITFDVYLGDYQRTETNFFWHFGASPRWGFRLNQANVERYQFAHMRFEDQYGNVYYNGLHTEVKSNNNDFNLLFGMLPTISSIFGGGFGLTESINQPQNLPDSLSVNPTLPAGWYDSIDQRNFYSFIMCWIDTRDRIYFTTSGLQVNGQIMWSLASDNESENWTVQNYYFEANQKIKRNMVLRAKFLLAKSNSRSYMTTWFQGDGYDTFVGSKFGQFAGNSLMIFRWGFQWEYWKNIFITLENDSGARTYEPNWIFDPDDYEIGYALSIGAKTAVGPLQLTYHGSSMNDEPMVRLNLGFQLDNF